MANPNKPFGCTICDKAFTQLKLLGNHVKKSHSNKKSKITKAQSQSEGDVSEKSCTIKTVDQIKNNKR